MNFVTSSPDQTRPTCRGRSFTSHDLIALVAADTFDPIADRITALLAHGRRMVLISGLLGDMNRDHRYDIHPGLRLARDVPEPISIWDTTGHQPGKQFVLHLDPGGHQVAFSSRNSQTERDLRAAWDDRAQLRRPVTQVRIEGFGTTPARDDRIEIEHWNDDGVGRRHTLVFQCDWDY